MRKILIIEDNEDIRENLGEILELAGYHSITAENGKTGVELAEKEVPDLIICDIMMPVLDGYGVLHILSKKPKTADIPFIFLTAKTEKSDFRYGMNLGADDYITKPFDKAELLNVIEIRLRKHEKLQKSSVEVGKGDLGSFINEARGYEALKNLALDKETRMYHKREVIYVEGAVPRYLYYINKGKVKLFKTNEDGKEFIISIHGEGDFLGHFSLLAENNYAESAGTLEDSELSMIPKSDFYTLLHSNRDVSARFIKMLANNVSEREEQLLHLAYNSVRKKVADALISLHDHFNHDVNSGISIFREDIAGMAGTAKETVIRTLTDFKEEKLIDIQNNKIFILNIQKLKLMLN